MKSNKKVTKLKKRFDFSVTYIIFFIFFIYILVYVGIYLSKEHLSIYEVKEGYTADNNSFVGLIIRNEELISSNAAGYVNYYLRDGERVAKNGIIYSTSEEKLVFDLENGEELSLSNKEINAISKEINEYNKDYNSNKFGQVYDFKYEMENLVLQVLKDQQLTNADKLNKNNKNNNNFSLNYSDTSGVVAYSMDGYEGISPKTISAEMFNMETYNKESLRTLDRIEREKAVYRIVKSEDWKIILPLDDSQHEKLKDLTQVKVTLGDNNLTTNVAIKLYSLENEKYAMLSLDKYMIQFINQRHIKIELELSSIKGLKIPVSSIIKKEFYMVPNEYFTEGGNSGSLGITLEEQDENRNVEHKFIATDIFYSDDEYGYVDTRAVPENSWIVSPVTGEGFRLTLIDTLDGVFNVNKGYAIFRRVEVLTSNEEYSIIKTGTKYGLDVYDHIALVGETAIEQEIIY